MWNGSEVKCRATATAIHECSSLTQRQEKAYRFWHERKGFGNLHSSTRIYLFQRNRGGVMIHCGEKKKKKYIAITLWCSHHSHYVLRLTSLCLSIASIRAVHSILGIIFSVWHCKRVLLPSLCSTGLYIFLGLFWGCLLTVFTVPFYYLELLLLLGRLFVTATFVLSVYWKLSPVQWASSWYWMQLKEHTWFSKDFSLIWTSWLHLHFHHVEISSATSKHPENKWKRFAESRVWIHAVNLLSPLCQTA